MATAVRILKNAATFTFALTKNAAGTQIANQKNNAAALTVRLSKAAASAVNLVKNP